MLREKLQWKVHEFGYVQIKHPLILQFTPSEWVWPVASSWDLFWDLLFLCAAYGNANVNTGNSNNIFAINVSHIPMRAICRRVKQIINDLL